MGVGRAQGGPVDGGPRMSLVSRNFRMAALMARHIAESGPPVGELLFKFPHLGL